MELHDSILKAFADSVNKSSDSVSDSKTVYGTVVRKDSSGIFVRLNGADSSVETPVVSTVEVGEGDVVMIAMKNHTATIIGNISFPALTRVGDIYITLTEDGLVIGKLDPDTNIPVGYYMFISDNDIQLRQIISAAPGYKVLARFGTAITLGVTNAMHSIVDSDGLKVFNNNTLLAKFGTTVQIGPNNSTHTVINANGMTVYNSSGTALVSIGITQARDSYGANVNGLYTIGSIYSEGGPMSVGNRSKKTKLDMIATPNSNVGLLANNSDWLIRRNNNTGKIYLGGMDIDHMMYITQPQLWTGSFNPPAAGIDDGLPGDYTDSDGFRCRPLNDITKWYALGLRVRVGNDYTSIVCYKAPGAVAYHLSDPSYSYNGTNYVVKASFKIKWTDGAMCIKRVEGPTATNECYAITGVYGLIPAPQDRTKDTSGATITPID